MTDNKVKYLVKVIKDCQIILDSKESKGWMRAIARQEAAKLQLNLDGYGWDWDKMNAYKVSQSEKREYFNAS